MPNSRVIVGDCIKVMRGMGAGSVQCCLTSPPYWNLRDYGVKGQLGLEATPEAYIAKMVEVFREVRRVLRDDGVLYLNMGDSYANDTKWGGATGGKHCDALHGATGIGRMKSRTGLKPKDLCLMPSRLALALQAGGWWVRSRLPWLKRSAMPESGASDGANVTFKLDDDGKRMPCDCGGGCPKCYDGYRLKGCAPDRPTSAIEYVFLLTKSKTCFWDAEAVRMKGKPTRAYDVGVDRNWDGRKDGSVPGKGEAHASGTRTGGNLSRAYAGVDWSESGRNFRNSDLFYESLKAPHGLICVGDEPVALDVNPEPFPGAHFATFPRKLVTPLIKAATSEKGCCPECGAPWKRIIEQTKLKRERPNDRTARHEAGDGVNACGNTVAGVAVKTLGWQPGCGCLSDDIVPFSGEPDDGTPVPFDPIPCTVLDPFCGSGTVGVAAKQLELSFIGIELNADYAKMAEQRIANPEPEPVVEDVVGQMELFDAPA